jgi:hypothetical protein
MTTSEESAWVTAIVVSAALMGMWAVLYLGMRSARDACCPARARRELQEALNQVADAPAPAPAAGPVGRAAALGPQRTARQRAGGGSRR